MNLQEQFGKRVRELSLEILALCAEIDITYLGSVDNEERNVSEKILRKLLMY